MNAMSQRICFLVALLAINSSGIVNLWADSKFVPCGYFSCECGRDYCDDFSQYCRPYQPSPREAHVYEYTYIYELLKKNSTEAAHCMNGSEAYKKGFDINALENVCFAGRITGKQEISGEDFEFSFVSTPMKMRRSSDKIYPVRYTMKLKKLELGSDQFEKKNYQIFKTEMELNGWEAMQQEMNLDARRFSLEESEVSLILRPSEKDKPDSLKGKPVYMATLVGSLKLPLDDVNHEIPLVAKTSYFGRFGSQIVSGAKDNFAHVFYPGKKTLESQRRDEGSIVTVTSVRIDQVGQQLCLPDDLADQK